MSETQVAGVRVAKCTCRRQDGELDRMPRLIEAGFCLSHDVLVDVQTAESAGLLTSSFLNLRQDANAATPDLTITGAVERDQRQYTTTTSTRSITPPRRTLQPHCRKSIAISIIPQSTPR